MEKYTEFDEMGFHPETTIPYPMVYADEWKRRMLYAIGQLRKETAEKFAEMVLSLFPTDKRFTTICRATIDEICKKITEGK